MSNIFRNGKLFNHKIIEYKISAIMIRVLEHFFLENGYRIKKKSFIKIPDGYVLLAGKCNLVH